MNWSDVEARINGALYASPLADAATYTPAVGSPVALRVQMSRSDLLSPPGYSAEYAEVAQVALMRLADLPAAPAQGDRLTVGASTWRVVAIEPTAVAGEVRLVLR